MRFAIILFVSIFGILSFAPNMQGGQFFKISEILEHYQDHQSGTETFDSFISFLKEHYSGDHDTKENEKQMPFKSVVACSSILVLEDFKITPIFFYCPVAEIEDHCFGEPKGKIQGKSIPVWNPPKLS